MKLYELIAEIIHHAERDTLAEEVRHISCYGDPEQAVTFEVVTQNSKIEIYDNRKQNTDR